MGTPVQAQMGQSKDSIEAPQFTLKWKFQTLDRVHSSAVVADDRIIFGSGDGNVYCLRSDSGSEIWRFETQGPAHSTGTIHDGTFFCTSGDGYLYAIEVQSGVQKWKFQTKGEKFKDMWDYYLSSPAVHDGLVYFGSGDGSFYAVDINDGVLQWKFDTSDIIHFSPLIWKEYVYFGGFDGYVYSLNHRNGDLNWKFKTVGDVYFPFGAIQKGGLIYDDALILGSRDYNIYALDALKGTGRWNMKERNSWVIAIPIEEQGNIYFGTSDSWSFYSMNAGNGEINWELQLSSRVFGSAVIQDQVLFFGTLNGKLYAVNKVTGQILSTFQTEGSKANYGTVYGPDGKISSEFNQLYRQDFELAERKLESLGPIYSTPLLHQGLIIFGSGDGNMYALEIK